MNPNTFFEPLDVPLTKDEVRQRGQALAKKIQERNLVKDRKKAANAEFKEQLDEIEEGIETLRRQVSGEKEERQVECREVFGGNNIVEVIRLDGHEPKIVRTRGMTENEIKDSRQGRLFVLEGQAKKEAEKKRAAEKTADGAKLGDAPELAPEPTKDVERVTISSGDKSVTLGDVKEALAEAEASEPMTDVEEALAADDAKVIEGAVEAMKHPGGGAELVSHGFEKAEEPETVTHPQTDQELVKVTRGGKKKKRGARGQAAAAEKQDEEPSEGDGTLV